MASEKHAHNWVVSREAVSYTSRGVRTTTYYYCTGCPLTKTENS